MREKNQRYKYLHLCDPHGPCGSHHEHSHLLSFVALVQITTDDLLQATQAEERGLLEKKERSPNMWKQLAINEAAMAVVAVNFPELRNIEFV